LKTVIVFLVGVDGRQFGGRQLCAFMVGVQWNAVMCVSGRGFRQLCSSLERGGGRQLCAYLLGFGCMQL
jgi:hypothetical protein